MNKQHTDIFSQTECLSLETIDQYIHDQLSAGERQRVEKHLIDCELCSDALDGLAASGDMAGVAKSVEVINEKIRVAAHKQFFGSFQDNYAKYAAVAAVVLIIFGSVFMLFKDKFKDSNELIVENLSSVQQEELPKESIPITKGGETKEEITSITKELTLERKDFEGNNRTFQKSTEVSPVQPSGLSRVTQDKKAGGAIPSSEMAAAQGGFDIAGMVSEEETKIADKDIETEEETTIDYALAGGEIDDLLADEAPAPEEKENKTLNAQELAEEEPNLPMKSDERLRSGEGSMGAAKSKSKRTQTGGTYARMAPKAAKEPEVTAVESDTISEIVSSTAEKLTDDQEVFFIVEEMPQFGEGDSTLHIYLSENIKYPSKAKEESIEGTVYLTFVIGSKGEVTDIKVLKGIGGGCDEEAVRLVENMPDWIPGKQRGNPVSVQYNLPVQFKL